MADEYSCMSQEELQIAVQEKDKRIAELEAIVGSRVKITASQSELVLQNLNLQANNERLREYIRENGKSFNEYGDHVRAMGCYAIADGGAKSDQDLKDE